MKNKYIEILEDTRNYADNMLEYYRREIEKCFLKAEEKIIQKFNMDLDNCRLCYQKGQKDGCYTCTQNNYNFTQYNTNINTAPQNSRVVPEQITPNYQNLIPKNVGGC